MPITKTASDGTVHEFPDHAPAKWIDDEMAHYEGNKPGPPSPITDTLKDVVESARSGVVHDAVPNALGMKGDAENLGLWLGEKIGGLFGKPPLSDEQKSNLMKPLIGPDRGPTPTSQDVKKMITEVSPEYEPKGVFGRVAKNTAGFAAGAVAGGPRSMLRTVVAPGVLSQGAKEAGDKLGLYPWMQNALYTAGGMAPAFRSGLGMNPTVREYAQHYGGKIAGGVGGYGLFDQIFGQEGHADQLAAVLGFHNNRLPGKLGGTTGKLVVGSGRVPPNAGDAAAMIRALQGPGAP